jgi:uncharacterized protein (TIGR02271 family)
MSTDYPTSGHGAGALAGVFIDRDGAHDALNELHRAGFRRVWLGVTRGGDISGDEPTIESEDAGGFMEAMGRFFGGEESRERPLHGALVAHGLSEAQARSIDAEIVPGNAVVIVDGENDSAEALAILEETGGKRFGDAGLATAPTTQLGSRSPDTTDDARRLQLREERLAIDKRRAQSGEARVGTRVVTERQSLDVPIFHEELYIERRPVRSGAVADATTPIGEGEVIRVPLMEERVNVAKNTAVREEVVIGKRRVAETEHVSESIRREELVVDDAS